MRPPTVLTIAGSDPSAGAGIQVDLETFRSCDVQGLSVVTVVTSQTAKKFKTLYALPKKVVGSQLSLLLDQYPIVAVKTGLLFKKEIIDLLVHRFKKLHKIKLVVDPVMKASLGQILLQPRALGSLKELIGQAFAVTPNLDEASVLSGLAVYDLAQMRKAAKVIYGLGPQHVLIKGGHLIHDPVDLFYDGKNFQEFPKSRIPSEGFHGLGCRFSAALTAFIAQGLPILEAVNRTENFMNQALRSLISE